MLSDLMLGVVAIAHVASVMSLDADPNNVIPVVKDGVINALEAAASQPSIKSLVYTSSSSAATSPGIDVGHDVREDSWNEDAIKRAWSTLPGDAGDHVSIYAASKTEAEKALWKWVGERNLSFIVNSGKCH